MSSTTATSARVTSTWGVCSFGNNNNPGNKGYIITSSSLNIRSLDVGVTQLPEENSQTNSCGSASLKQGKGIGSAGNCTMPRLPALIRIIKLYLAMAPPNTANDTSLLYASLFSDKSISRQYFSIYYYPVSLEKVSI